MLLLKLLRLIKFNIFCSFANFQTLYSFIDNLVAGRGLSEVMETGRRNTGEVNLSEVEERPKTFTDLNMAKTLTRRKMKRSVIDEEEEYGDYADYNDGEQDYPESNTLYEDAPEVTIARKKCIFERIERLCS